jgi:hypothetical protein
LLFQTIKQVLDAHCGFLSNFEVLQALQEDVAEQDVLVKAFKENNAKAKKSRFNQPPLKAEPFVDFQDQLSKIVSNNVRTLQVEVSQCFSDSKNSRASLITVFWIPHASLYNI